MSKDDVAKHIQEQMEEPTEINAEDLTPPICTWCGDELGPDVEIVTWDIPEHGNEDVVYRYRYCSDDCRDADENAIVNAEEMHPNGEPERLTEDDREIMTDGGVDQDAAGIGRLLIRVVLPAGIGIIAFAQAPGAHLAITWGLVALTALTFFVAFRESMKLADDQLNNSGEWNVE